MMISKLVPIYWLIEYLVSWKILKKVEKKVRKKLIGTRTTNEPKLWVSLITAPKQVT
jgi:hypothetical protein